MLIQYLHYLGFLPGLNDINHIIPATSALDHPIDMKDEESI